MSGLEYPAYMQGMMNAPFDYSKCKDCGGTGLRAVICCNGLECGCKGVPVDFVECENGCGFKPPSDKQIFEWKEGSLT